MNGRRITLRLRESFHKQLVAKAAEWYPKDTAEVAFERTISRLLNISLRRYQENPTKFLEELNRFLRDNPP